MSSKRHRSGSRSKSKPRSSPPPNANRPDTMPDNELDFDVVYASGAVSGQPNDPSEVADSLAAGDGWLVARQAEFKDVSNDQKARELKTILLEEKILFIKFVVHSNYPNKQNHYNQVCIMDIDLFGQQVGRQPVAWRPTTVARNRLITQERRRRISLANTATPTGTGLGERRASDSCKSLRKLIGRVEQRLQLVDDSDERHNASRALQTLTRALSQCAALSVQSATARDQSDVQFAAACDREAGRVRDAAACDKYVRAALKDKDKDKDKLGGRNSISREDKDKDMPPSRNRRSRPAESPAARRNK